jgi:hypothetical protein
VDRKELEMRIWGKSIASARKAGIISEVEAQFLVDEYFKEFRVKHGWNGKAYVHPHLSGSSFPARLKRWVV